MLTTVFTRADIITWTNTSGGNWSDSTSWNPNQVPGANDDAVIAAGGTYLVTLDISPTINSLTLGGSSGQQTLATAANNLTLNSASTVGTNGDFQLSGGVLGGGLFTLNGRFDWTAGQIGANCELAIATNGIMVVDTGISGSYVEFSGIITNAGSIILTNGGIRCIDYNIYGGGYGLLVNAPSGTIDLQDGSIIDFYNDNSGIGTPAVINYGTVRKSSGSDTNLINAPFYNFGKVDAQLGTMSLNGGGNGNGVFQAEAGATLAFANDYEVDRALTGAGTNSIIHGTFVLNGSLNTSNVVLAGDAVLEGTNGIIADQFTWNSSARIGTNCVLAIATNGVMIVDAGNSGSYVEFSGIITNAGSIVLTNGGIRCIDYNIYGGGYGLLVNAPSGTIDLRDGSIIDFYNDNSGIGAPAVINYGIVRKTSGSDTNLINAPFYNFGKVDAQLGTISLNGGGSGSGVFQAEAGATLDYPADYEVDGTISGAGTNLLDGGILTFDGTITGQFVWTSGRISTNSIGTVATNGLMIVDSGASGSYVEFSGVLTNAGTIMLTNGGIRCIDYNVYGGGYGLLVNAPSGTIDLQDGSIIDFYTDNSGTGTPAVVNYGTVRKSSGSDTNLINAPFYNYGTLDAQKGAISLNGSYDLTGGTLNFGLNSSTDFGQIALSGAANLTGTVSVNLNNGYVPSTGSSFPVLTYGSESGIFTNSNLPFADAWQTNYDSTDFTLTVLNVRPTLTAITNQTVNELTTLSVTNSATDPDSDQTLAFALVSAPGNMSVNSTTGVITWTPAQTQSPSTNTILVSVTDNGTPPLSATNSFIVVVKEVNVAPTLPVIAQTNVNELTQLTVTNTANNFNIHSIITGYTLVNPPTNMIISASGVITWTPAQAQSPGTNIITTIVTNSNPYDLINPRLTSTNQFTVVVKEVNVAPTLPIIAQTNVNELTLLTVTNAANNFNIHSIITGYSLVNPPTNMVISAGGVITWTPSQAQSPGTNIITTIVTNSNPYDLINPRLTSTNQFTVVVKEVNVAPTLPVIAQTNVNELTLLTVTNAASNFNIHSTNFGYTLVNPPTNMVISASGVITWTPAQAQSPGTNIITTVVTNSNPYDLINPHLTSTNQFTVIVKEVNVAPTLPVIAQTNVNELALLTVTNTAIEANIHSTVGYTLVSPPAGMVISASGVITWTPAQAQSPGTNIITTIVTNTDSFDTVNPHLSATNSFTVIVYAPTLAPITNYTVNVGQTVGFTATATDNDSTRTLTFSLISPPVGASLNSSSGLFNWRLAAAQANTTNIVQVKVTDNSAPSLSATGSFTVTVNPLASVVLTPISYTNGQFKMQVSGTTGPDYIIMTSGGLTTWTDLATNLSPTTPFQYTATNAVSSTNHFYRVRLSP